jgi:hypothetical protein
VRLSEHVLECASRPLARDLLHLFFSCAYFQVPPEVLALKGQRGEPGQTDCELQPHPPLTTAHLALPAAVNFSEYDSLPSGQVSLVNRIKYALLVPIYRVLVS